VVEDHEETAVLITTVLEDEGYEVTRGARAEDAIKACCPLPTTPPGDGHRQASYPDLVLLDLTLPDMEYTEMASRLRECRQTSPPIIVLSAMSEGSIEKAATTIGAAAIVRKPFSVDALLTHVNEALAFSLST